MTTSLTIEEVQYKKEQLVRDLFTLVKTFEQETACNITDIDIYRLDLNMVDGSNRSIVGSISITV